MVPDDTLSADETETASADSRPVDAPSPDAGRTASNGFLAPGDDAPADLGDVLIYGLVGGIAGSVLSFVPFATVLGGAVAGYLCGGRSADALKTGAVAGVVMTLPFAAAVAFLLFFLGIAGAPAEFGVVALFVIGLAAAYTLGSGIVGGYLGRYLRGKL
ncbi:DUF5518 domain-containing protein [Halorubrum sp. CSM-61]|uniref:DUF5518 domain-containing protein n=1 Tax=Halorubrum sp. CSM-61 TaxID=2485838 RepID=UPI000F4C1963|nr:DUF5518 domain-containing protein [Halorubrum sp. CSM-61]